MDSAELVHAWGLKVCESTNKIQNFPTTTHGKGTSPNFDRFLNSATWTSVEDNVEIKYTFIDDAYRRITGNFVTTWHRDIVCVDLIIELFTVHKQMFIILFTVCLYNTLLSTLCASRGEKCHFFVTSYQKWRYKL